MCPDRPPAASPGSNHRNLRMTLLKPQGSTPAGASPTPPTGLQWGSQEQVGNPSAKPSGEGSAHVTRLLAIPGSQGHGRGLFHFCHFNQPGHMRRHPQLRAPREGTGGARPERLHSVSFESTRTAPAWPGSSLFHHVRCPGRGPHGHPPSRKRASVYAAIVAFALGSNKEERRDSRRNGIEKNPGQLFESPRKLEETRGPGTRTPQLHFQSPALCQPAVHLIKNNRATLVPTSAVGGPPPPEPPPPPSPHRPAQMHWEPENTG